MITIYLNPGDLASWQALEPLKKLWEDTAIAIDWQPLMGSLGNVANSNREANADDPLAAYKARRARARQQAAARELERSCERMGISLAQANRKIDTTALSLALAWTNRSADTAAVFRFVEAAFNAVFRTAEAIETLSDVEGLLVRAGIETDGFSEFAEESRDALLAGQDALIEKGILSSPAFVVEDEIFLGREHLPLITWMISGREGTPPV